MSIDRIQLLRNIGQSVEAFCELRAQADIEGAIREAERQLAAAQSADAVRQTAAFATRGSKPDPSKIPDDLDLIRDSTAKRCFCPVRQMII